MNMLDEPNVRILAHEMKGSLDAVEASLVHEQFAPGIRPESTAKSD